MTRTRRFFVWFLKLVPPVQLKIILKYALLTVIIAECIVSITLSLDFVSHDRDSALIVDNVIAAPKQEQSLPTPKLPSYGLPVRIKIPKINVDSFVEHVGVASNGGMDVPKERSNVAWFNLGSRPGEVGNAVIAGHYGRENGAGSAFDNLHKLRKGDAVYVEDDRGQIVTFVVRESRRYDPETKTTDNADIFGSIDGKSHLNLITCEGGWDEKTQQYTKRLVVFADREMQI